MRGLVRDARDGWKSVLWNIRRAAVRRCPRTQVLADAVVHYPSTKF